MPTVNPISYVNVSSYGQSASVVVSRSPFHAMLENDLECTFFGTTDFAISISYQHQTGESVTYWVIKNNEYEDMNVLNQINNMDRQMVIRVQESKLIREPKQGDRALIEGIPYKVDNVMPNGLGITNLHMNRV